MSTVPPIRIRRARPGLLSASAAASEPTASSRPPSPPKPTTPPKKLATPPKPTAPVKPPRPERPDPPIVEAKPKGPATTPRKPRPPAVRVDNPRRLRKQGRKHLNGVFVGNARWGSPFRPREINGRWVVAWTGADQDLDQHKPVDWQDIPCGSRLEAAHLALTAFRDWISAPAQSGLLDRARASLRGYNLVCHCPEDYPCHGDVLLELVNEAASGSQASGDRPVGLG